MQHHEHRPKNPQTRMSKTRIYTILMTVATAALAVWAVWLWLLMPMYSGKNLERTAYGVCEGKQLVMLKDSRGNTALNVEDANGRTLFSIPVHDCVLAARFQNGRLPFRMKHTGQTGYIDTLGTAYLTATDTRPDRPDEGKNTAHIEPQQPQPTAVADKPEQHEKPEPEARRQSLIAQADLRHMAKSNPFYAEAAKVVQGHLEEKDSASRHKILDYCEHFRTAYTRRDIAFLRQVFSDKALIIVGSVVKSGAQQDGAQSAGMVKYSIRTKEDYLARLEKVFQTNRKINVRFTDFRIMRHPSTDGIYGVQLRQRYQADRYSDDGYLFLLWDFRNPERPLIHVRTWQPETDVREGVELIDLSYFNLD